MTVPYPEVDTRAPCRHGDADRFFPRSGVADPDVLDECRACPFIDACLNYALHHDVVGIWGATTTNDRRVMRRRNGIVPRSVHVGHEGGPRHLNREPAACGTTSGYSRHRNHGEKPCQPCRDAMSAQQRDYYARKKARA